MRHFLRRVLDKAFTAAAGLSVVLMGAALVIILGPILYRGGQAVFFKGTVEYRRMRLMEFADGSSEAVKAEMEQAHAAQKPVWDLYRGFARGIDVSWYEHRTKYTAQEFTKQVQNRADEQQITPEEETRLRRAARKVRDELLGTDDKEGAFTATTADAANEHLDAVLNHKDRDSLKGTVAEQLFGLAEEYKRDVEHGNLALREKYAAHLLEVKQALWELLGPPPDRPADADLAQFRYGATRWDRAQILLDRLLWHEQHVPTEPGKPNKLVRTPRAEMFAGTELAALFPLVEHNLESMLRPRQTVYLRYFIDSSTIGGLFGGVGPELLGTLLLTVVTMILALPVGVITAAYLVECTREGLLIRFIRMCINTLAGVPSIVFGLFGLAFFVIFAPDLANSVLTGLGLSLKLPGNRTILYGAFTLAVLVLPIIIRASEEAIKAVPHSYKEAALSLGAGGFRTFVSVTFPAALPGILTGVILSMSRAAGETAPILFTAAVAFGAVPHSVLEPTRALPYSAYVFATGDDLAPKAPHNQYGMIMSLVLLVLVLNVAAILIRSRVARKLRGQ